MLKKSGAGFTTFMKTERGFTLVELLITISIIAILSVIGMVAYSAVLKQGRDSKRLSDLRSIQSALEQYHADQFYYPLLNTGACGNGTLTFGCALKNPTGSRTYLNTVPIDPTGIPYPQYIYTALPFSPPCDNVPTTPTKCTSYCLYANLENSNPGVGSCDALTGYNFAVTPP